MNKFCLNQEKEEPKWIQTEISLLISLTLYPLAKPAHRQPPTPLLPLVSFSVKRRVEPHCAMAASCGLPWRQEPQLFPGPFGRQRCQRKGEPPMRLTTAHSSARCVAVTTVSRFGLAVRR